MAAEQNNHETQLGDLPEACLSYAIALTSPRDASRCAAVSPAFRAAADSDHVWQRFIPELVLDQRAFLLDKPSPTATSDRPAKARKKDAYLDLCDGGGVPVDGEDGGGCRVWLEKASGAKCYALSARRLYLPWDDGEFSWKWTPHPNSRFGEVAELVDCTCLDICAKLPAAALTSSTGYAAYLVYETAEDHRGLSYPDQETTVAVGSRVLERHSVCLWPNNAETRKFRGAGLIEEGDGTGDKQEEPRLPRRREDGWWEIEMGRLRTLEEVIVSFEVFGWYPKRGLIVEGIEFRPVHNFDIGFFSSFNC